MDINYFINVVGILIIICIVLFVMTSLTCSLILNLKAPDGTDILSEKEVYNINISSEKEDTYYIVDDIKINIDKIKINYDKIENPILVIKQDYDLIPIYGKRYYNQPPLTKKGYHYILTLPYTYKIN